MSQLDKLYQRLDALRLNAGLSGEDSDYNALDEAYAHISELEEQERKAETECRMRRAKAVAGIIQYRKMRQAFTVA